MTSTKEESSLSHKEQKEDNSSKIDKLLSYLTKKAQQTIEVYILNYFKKNDYNSIKKKEIISTLINEYNISSEKFIDSNQICFNSKNTFIEAVNNSLKKDLFNCFNQNKMKYIEINQEKAFEYLTSLKNNKANRTKNNKRNDKNDKRWSHNLFLNKKTKRNKSDAQKNHKRKSNNKRSKKEMKEPEQSKLNNIRKIENKKDSPKKDNEEITSEKIYNNIFFHQSHFSKLTFNDKILANNSNPSSHNSYFFNVNNFENYEPPAIPKEPKDDEELLYISKDEEDAFKIISKEIKPLGKKLSEINSFINNKQKKVELISDLLVEMSQNTEKYKTTKIDYNDKVNEIKACFKGIDDNTKILKNSGNVSDMPFKDVIFNSHMKFIQNILKKTENLVENKDNITNKLNNYDIAFSSAKILVENYLKEIIEYDCENGNENDIYESLKNYLKQNFEEAFKKLNLDNTNDCSSKGENYHDMKNIYEKNIQIKSEFDNYVEKVKSFEE